MLLVIRRDLGVLFAKEEGVVKERKRKKEKKSVFEHLMLSEKNNEFNCLKTTTQVVTQVLIIENIFKEESLQNVG